MSLRFGERSRLKTKEPANRPNPQSLSLHTNTYKKRSRSYCSVSAASLVYHNSLYVWYCHCNNSKEREKKLLRKRKSDKAKPTTHLNLYFSSGCSAPVAEVAVLLLFEAVQFCSSFLREKEKSDLCVYKERDRDQWLGCVFCLRNAAAPDADAAHDGFLLSQ